MIPMLMLPKILHLESTDACQAACPQCAREFDTSFDKNNLHHLTVDQINKLLIPGTIKQLDKMYMCGDYGDPAAGKYTLEIYKHFRSLNSNITLGMNTNGGIRTTDWWEKLAQILNRDQDYVIFSLDGLEDTNHIYRVNVNWQRVMENVQAFISAGGNAHWDMLVFEHNEHQVEECEQLARELGFKWFRAKVSRRFDFVPMTVDFLHPPKGWKEPDVVEGTIKCQAINEESLYISAQGTLFPCCYLGATEFNISKFDDIQQSWTTDNPNYICKSTCMSSETSNSEFISQWQREIKLK